MLAKSETKRGSVSHPNGSGAREGRRVDSHRGSRNKRRSASLRGLTTAGREGGITSLETVRIGLTGKHRGKDGSNKEQEGQGEGSEPVHGGNDVSWGRGGKTLRG